MHVGDLILNGIKSKEKHTPERLCEILNVKSLNEYTKGKIPRVLGAN